MQGIVDTPLVKRHVQIQGHRGGYKPDNVIATFTKSLESGLEAIELDVRE